jgi:hypothetical protein
MSIARTVVSGACPHCGAPAVPTDLVLPPFKQVILDAVRRHPGISAEELRALVWAHDPEGGPESFSCLHVHVSQLNKLIVPHGIVVRGSRFYGYRVLPIRAGPQAS